ncbi:MAG: hypothetical protein JWO47_406 [Candidatus Saccharibacteria bacterium]|nr:hypothetical protein [Candidatus Saccharibacteria bacterium]
MNFVLIEGSFDLNKIGYDFSEVIEESEQGCMLPLSPDTIGANMLTGVVLVGQTVVATSAIKEHVTVLDKRNPDFWQPYDFALLGGCVTTERYKRIGINTQMIKELTQKSAVHPGLTGVTGFFNEQSAQVVKRLDFTDSCFWLWGQKEINENGRTRHSLIFPAKAQ